MSPVHILLHYFILYNLKIRLPGESVHALQQQHKKHQSESLEPWRLRKVHVSQRGKDPLSGSKDLCTGELTSVSGSGREMVMGRFVREMIEDSFSGNREDSSKGGRPQWKHGQKVWEYQREGVLLCSKGKELPDREEKNRQLNGLNNVLLTAEMRSTSALQVPYSIQPMQNYATLVCRDCKIHRQFQGLNAEN